MFFSIADSVQLKNISSHVGMLVRDVVEKDVNAKFKVKLQHEQCSKRQIFRSDYCGTLKSSHELVKGNENVPMVEADSENINMLDLAEKGSNSSLGVNPSSAANQESSYKLTKMVDPTEVLFLKNEAKDQMLRDTGSTEFSKANKGV